jgi:D-beta-D-heptose 7-phosphate kinase/D-beta-D-heptose 1-phosphate adenosyltransferase
MIVFTNGCFDILHRGHIEYLKQSKALGTFLIVGINSDESVKRLKGESRPINNQMDRKLVLEELRCVDKVIIFEEDTPYELIKKLAPDIITKGGDYKVEDVVGHDLVRTIIIPYLEGYSTSSFLQGH